MLNMKQHYNFFYIHLSLLLIFSNSLLANPFQSIKTDTMPTGNYADVNGIRMYYEIHQPTQANSNIIPLVLIHGGGSTIQSTFGNVLSLFAQQYKVIAVELQAHGRTSDRNAPESFEQDADDVAALLEHLNISKANILGFSNGGSTTMRIATRHAGLVNKIVVIAAFYQRDGMLPGFFEMMQRATINDMPQALKDAFLKVTPDTAKLHNMFEKDRSRMANFKDWTDADLKAIKAPALIISGDKDVASNEHTVKMSRLIAGSELMILPGVHGECIGEVETAKPGSKLPELTVAVITEFLQK